MSVLQERTSTLRILYNPFFIKSVPVSCRYGFFCICKKIAPLKKGATVKMLLFVCFVVVIASGLCGILAIGRSGITVFVKKAQKN